MKLTVAIAASALAASAFAQSAPGFQIPVSKNLRVVYNSTNVTVTPPGVLLPRNDTLNPPTAYLPSSASNSSNYILFLIDQDVPRNNTRTTLLHYFIANLVASPSALVQVNTTTAASTAVGAAYIPPTPPGGSGPHSYTFLLFEQPANWAVPAAYVAINPPAATTARVGFNVTDFVAASGLGAPIAANYLRVLNGTASETSSALTMTGTAVGGAATSSGSAMASASASASSSASASASSMSSAVASSSRTAASASATASGTSGVTVVRSNGKEVIALLAMAVVGAAAWTM